MWEGLQQFYVAAQGRKKAKTIKVCENLSPSLLIHFEILASDMFLQFSHMFHHEKMAVTGGLTPGSLPGSPGQALHHIL